MNHSPAGRWDHHPAVKARHNREVLAAAKKEGLFIPPEKLARVTASPNVGGLEHDVHEDAENNRFFKFTKGGHFGQNKDVHEYIDRHRVANELWPELGYRFHGITQSPADGSPQTVLSMNRIEGTKPEQEEVDEWFESNGWEPAEESGSAPNRWRDPKTGTVIGDAHAGNFIKTAGGLVPIDVDVLPGSRPAAEKKAPAPKPKEGPKPKGDGGKAPEAHSKSIAQAFASAPGAKDNHVAVGDLVRASGLPKEQVHAELQRLRKAGVITLQGVEGRGGIKPDDKEHGIEEDGRVLARVAVRDDDEARAAWARLTGGA